MRVEMTTLAGVDLDRRRAGGANALRVVRCLLIALDHGDREAFPQFADRARQQRRLAGARTRHQIQRESPASRQTRAVLRGIAIVLPENVAFDFDDALLRQAGDVNAGGARAKIDHGRGVFARGVMAVIVVVGMPVIMGVTVIMGVRATPSPNVHRHGKPMHMRKHSRK